MWKPDILITRQHRENSAALVGMCKVKWPDVYVVLNDLGDAPDYAMMLPGKHVLILDAPERDWIVRQNWASCIVFYDDVLMQADLYGFSADWLLKQKVDQIGNVTGCVAQYIDASSIVDVLGEWLGYREEARHVEA